MYGVEKTFYTLQSHLFFVIILQDRENIYYSHHPILQVKKLIQRGQINEQMSYSYTRSSSDRLTTFWINLSQQLICIFLNLVTIFKYSLYNWCYII